MQQRKLGSQGPELTTIGFGTWAMGGEGKGGANGWGPQDDQDSIDAINTALERGINWFDTAPAYGFGHAEEILGRALGQRRKDVFVATKFGLVWDDQWRITNNARYDSVIRECDASLKRLGTDYIDLYQQHWPDTIGTPVEDSMRAVDDLIKAGKVRFSGVSNFDVPLLERAETVRHVDSLQPQYSLFHREPEDTLLPYCREHGVGVVAYSPLASGLLGGTYTPDKTFPETDWRSGHPDFTGEGLRRNIARVDRLKEVAGRFDKTVAQLAVAWVLANPAVTAAIVGIRRPAHLLGVLPAADWTLDRETLSEIGEIMSTQPAVR
jgi:aryl-alcohol dehydrogenase-like predicted oxidoreductase